MPSLPTPLLNDIIRRAGRLRFRNLGPFLLAGREGNSAALEDDVLREANLDELIHSPELVKEGSVCRPLLRRCLKAGNKTAMYLEGLRLLAQTGPSEEGINMIAFVATDNIYASLAHSIFAIFCGEYEVGMACMWNVFRKMTRFAEAVRVAEVIVNQIQIMGTPHSSQNRWISSFSFTPVCVSGCDDLLGI